MKKIIFILISLFFVVQMNGEVPFWSKTAVWYQIFPERFCNGDTLNDPTPKDIRGGWPYFEPENWSVIPWNWDWFARYGYEKELDMGFYELQGLRRYGGDLVGVIKKLDYLKDLGINAIYLNPIFESPSLHKYDAAYYHHVDDNFGPNPDLDKQLIFQERPGDPASWQWTTADTLFLGLIRQCHARGIKVIIDGVFNHVGNRFWAFRDVMEKQEKSEFKDWFYIKKWDDPLTEENEFDYEGWYGVKDLPELKEDENGLIEPVKKHIFEVVKRWMDPNGDGNPMDGIDGWRLDVAEKVNIKFWKEFHDHVKSINPQAYITGEIWWDDWNANVMFDASPWLDGQHFDGVMNYRFANAVKEWVVDKKMKISTAAFIDTMDRVREQYPLEHVLSCQNLYDSHDVDRIGSQIVNPDRWYDHIANAGQNKEYSVRRPNAHERKIQRFMVALQMTFPGAPMVYYGDEAGMWGGDDPDCRKPMVWKELKYDDETALPNGETRNPDKVEYDNVMAKFYKRMIQIRKENRILALGDIEFKADPDFESILYYKRKFEFEEMLVAANNSHAPIDVSIPMDWMKNKESWTEITEDKNYKVVKNTLSVRVPAYGILIFK